MKVVYPDTLACETVVCNINVEGAHKCTITICIMQNATRIMTFRP